jgi:hypothetical protein
MRYSGGGITVEQMVIEDVLGAPFETVAREKVQRSQLRLLNRLGRPKNAGADA